MVTGGGRGIGHAIAGRLPSGVPARELLRLIEANLAPAVVGSAAALGATIPVDVGRAAQGQAPERR